MARCVKSAIRYNRQGNFNNSPDNRRVGTKPPEMTRRIVNTSKIFHKKVQLTSWDYKKVLNACTDDDLVYMDPPYQGTCGDKDHRYFGNFDHDEFCDEIMKLNERNIMFAISYDGKTGNKIHGKPLRRKLNLKRIEINAGRSTQATLLGKNVTTYESLYLSQTLVNAIKI